MDEILESCKIQGDLVTVENAEEHYKNSYGDMYSHDGSAIKFYMQHFTKEDFLKWNVDIVKRMIGEYKEADKIIYTDKEEGWKHFYDLSCLVCMIYVEDKDIYKQRIELLKKLYKDYGYFMNYSFFCEMTGDTELYQQWFDRYWCVDPFPYTEEVYAVARFDEPTESFFYDRSRIRTGLIPDLYYLGYYDLLDEYLEECFLPICLHHGKEGSEYSKYYGYKVDDRKYWKLKNLSYIADPIKFLRKRDYKFPKESDEFWKENGL